MYALILYFNMGVFLLLSGDDTFQNDQSGPGEILWDAKFSADGKYLAVGGNCHALMLYSGKEYEHLKRISIANTITKFKWHPSENILAIATQMSSNKTCILNVLSGEWNVLDSISEFGARGIDWNYKGQLLAVGDNDGMVNIFNKDGHWVRKLGMDPKSITGLSWNPAKNTLVTVGSQIGIYDMDADSLLQVKPRLQEVLMLSVEWHPSGDFFVTGDYGDYDEGLPALLQFWNAEGNLLKEIQESKAEYRNLSWSENGRFLASASDALRIWSKEGTLLKKAYSEDLLWGVDWRADGACIATSSEKGTVSILDKDLSKIKVLTY